MIEQVAKPKIFLVDLDAILDTRLGTLLKHFGPEYVHQCMMNGYHDRTVDKFRNIKFEEFQELYAKRDRDTLKASVKTPILEIVSDWVRQTTHQSFTSPWEFIPTVLLNIYPYDLTEPEKQVLAGMLRDMTLGDADILIDRLSYENITPAFIGESVSNMAMYDAPLWLDTQAGLGTFKKRACPLTSVLTPAMYRKYPLTMQEEQEIKKSKTNAFRLLEQITEPFCNLTTLPVAMFSSVIFPAPTQPE